MLHSPARRCFIFGHWTGSFTSLTPGCYVSSIFLFVNADNALGSWQVNETIISNHMVLVNL